MKMLLQLLATQAAGCSGQMLVAGGLSLSVSALRVQPAIVVLISRSGDVVVDGRLQPLPERHVLQVCRLGKVEVGHLYRVSVATLHVVGGSEDHNDDCDPRTEHGNYNNRQLRMLLHFVNVDSHGSDLERDSVTDEDDDCVGPGEVEVPRDRDLAVRDEHLVLTGLVSGDVVLAHLHLEAVGEGSGSVAGYREVEDVSVLQPHVA